MTQDQSFDWLSLDEDERIVWSGNPKIQRLIGFTFTDYVATTDALYRKTGIFSRSVQKIGLEKVQNISFSQGVIGKTFGYGNIEISTAGGSGVEMRFRGIDSPKEVQEEINTQTKKQRKDSEEGSGGEDVMNQMLDELKKIRRAVEDN